MITEKLCVDDMQCQGCAGRVQKVLLNSRGVVKVITSLDDHSAEVTYDENAISNEQLVCALQSAGFLTTGPKCC